MLNETWELEDIREFQASKKEKKNKWGDGSRRIGPLGSLELIS